MSRVQLLNADNIFALSLFDDNSVDAIVTDPPYGLSFMNKKWDYDVPSVEMWREALRVLKPGGHLLSFGGTRTYHRMVVAIEDAGFEIRDQIQWLYGSGFPKSHDISKAIDKQAGAEREVVGHQPYKSNLNIQKGNLKGADCLAENYVPTPITAPATDSAKQWQGFGTALKPANEPIVLARKPLEKGLTVAQNVLKYGTGALNIDASRIGNEVRSYSINADVTSGNFGNGANQPASERAHVSVQGRWPANIILDEAAAEMLDEQSGLVRHSEPFKKLTSFNFDVGGKNTAQKFEPQKRFLAGASRFFYVAKASKRERNAGLEVPPKPQANHHPTVKPIKLMEYLCRLITPPNGTILDPFMGSGSTGVAALNLGFKFVGIELSEEYFEIAQKRIEVANGKV